MSALGLATRGMIAGGVRVIVVADHPSTVASLELRPSMRVRPSVELPDDQLPMITATEDVRPVTKSRGVPTQSVSGPMITDTANLRPETRAKEV